MRVLLITSHYMGVLYIEELLKAGDEIVGVVAWPNSMGWYVPPEFDVRTKAFRHYLPLYEPEPKELNHSFLPVIEKLAPDIIVSGYYSQIFGRRLLSIPPKGCVNTHPTGLPRFRGLSPNFTHILFGDKYNEITLHWLDPGVDTGDIIGQGRVEIMPDDTGHTCGTRLTEAGRDVFRENWPLIKAGKAPRLEQDPSRASNYNFSWAVAEMDWSKSAVEIWNLVRAISRPLQGAWTLLGGRKLHVWKVCVVEPGHELREKEAVPGQILAVTGRGVWVQTGRGQVHVVESTFDEDPALPIAALLPAVNGAARVLLG
jgi:methionyl-tRNA formyltransferase